MKRSQSFSQLQTLDNEIPICIFQLKNANYCNEQSKQQKTIFEESFALHTRQCITPLQKYQNYALGNTEIRRGALQLKINNGGFKKVNILLTREKIVILDNQLWSKVYNLKYLSFSVVQCIKNSFKMIKINFITMKTTFTFKCNDEIEGKLWFQCFKMIEERFYNEFEKFTILDRFFGVDFMREEEFYSCAETGDILLFETNHYMAKLQRGVTGSNFDHIGMVVRDRSDGEIMVFDVRNLQGELILNIGSITLK